ncbi:DedA family protein [Rhodovastum atsumiense]|uniref:DedA family protein n=1 Tax=Rhodovastum atsumiense TaxID=504468 RepID=A0A5M6IPC9_9PROT|nr:DedA family protein [Rhodovastum atsumiense]KAA5610133.1 DedA family protein [Rhodovastum atsumiense]CAH2599222.1 DedA family protein [Rhodovastum atsumiense]
MAEFWAEWGILGYLGAAGWAFFEGETFVLIAAAAGRTTGLIDPWILMICVWLGSFAGDQVWFTLGRRYGKQALRRFRGAEPKVEAATRFLERYGDLFVLTFRFAYGIRNVASAACGLAGMNHLRFAMLNFIAAGIWAASFVTAGWFLAGWLGAKGVGWTIGLVGLAVIIGLIWRFHRQRSATPARAGAVP